jgi:MFS family permease
MVALDVTIVNIALPHIQSALHFSGPGLAWVIDAYTLVFGGLMLLGGRAADFLGRKRMFNRALAAYAGATGGGGVLGLIIGGLLIAAAPRAIPAVGRAEVTGRPSVLSAVLSVIGIGALVYGFLHAASNSWRSPVTIGAFVVAATGIAAFSLLQARSAQPLLPLRLFRNRNYIELNDTSPA